MNVSQAYNAGVPPEIEFFQSRWGGFVTQKTTPTANRRSVWNWVLSERTHLIAFLKVIEMFGILKVTQATAALGFLRGEIDGPSATIYVARQKDSYRTINIDEKRITIPYLAGFFTAEGCVRIRAGKLVAIISQPSCPVILESIQSRHGGTLTKHFQTGLVRELSMCCHGALEFCAAIEQFAFGQKIDQLRVAIQFSEKFARLPRGSKGRQTLRKETENMLKELKKR